MLKTLKSFYTWVLLFSSPIIQLHNRLWGIVDCSVTLHEQTLFYVAVEKNVQFPFRFLTFNYIRWHFMKDMLLFWFWTLEKNLFLKMTFLLNYLFIHNKNNFSISICLYTKCNFRKSNYFSAFSKKCSNYFFFYRCFVLLMGSYQLY